MTRVTRGAHGCVNLIGEHTYNGGFVLPTPIPQRTLVELKRRGDDVVRVWSGAMGRWEEYRLGDEQRRGGWLDYVMGCTFALRQAGLRHAGCELSIESDVPLGAGLSSSAALEVAVLRAIRDAYALALDDTQLALLGERAETDLVGAPAEVMAQMCASLGELGAALFIDTRTRQARRIPLPRADLLVIASGIRHDHSTGGYRTRLAECEEAARQLGVATLRDVGLEDRARVARLPAPLGRRAHHVITENARVLAAVQAIERGDLDALGRLFLESHASQRDDFEVSAPQLDTLVAIATNDPDVIGARLTGGGFGGSIVALARAGASSAASRRITGRYTVLTGVVARTLVGGGLAP